jgi:hypothetical protein
MKSDLKSQLHKELRKGRADVLKWSRLFDLAGGSSKAYSSMVVLEETRNCGVLRRLNDESLSGDEVLKLVAGSRKWWERPNALEIHAIFTASWAKACRGERLSDAEAKEALRTKTDLGALAHAWYSLDKAGQREGHSILVDRLASDPDAEILRRNRFHPFGDLWDSAKLVMEKLTGVWDSSMNEVRDLRPGVLRDGVIGGLAQLDALDVHTYLGKQLFLKYGADLRPQRPFPWMDLRWSGMIVGCTWRACAYAQFGEDYVGKAWEEVDIPATLWDQSLEVDAFFSEPVRKVLAAAAAK